jgi:Threonine dehydrogenase and related Zn-dependent dehydrogenases
MNDKNYHVVFSEKGKVELLETEMLNFGDKEVLIQTELTQISTGTELTMLEANVTPDSTWARTIKFPYFPGYSNIGTVLKAGKEVDPEWVGKRVLTYGRHVKYFAYSFYFFGVAVPDGMDSDDAIFALLSQVSLASLRAAAIRPGDAVAVFGAGLIGQLTARLAQLAGAVKVFVMDVSAERLALLPNNTSFIPINSGTQNPAEAIREHNRGELAHIVYETTGVPSLVETELKCLAQRGTLVITSSPKGPSLVDLDYCSRQGMP